MKAARSLCAATALLVAGALEAQPLGGEFRVNTTTTDGQNSGAVAASADGRFVVVWTGDDGDSRGVFAQRYASSGAPLGGEFRVNSLTTGGQVLPAVASDFYGDFVVVWTGNELGLGDNDVFGQRYASTGAPLGGPFRVDTATNATQTAPDVAMSPAGNFVVAFVQSDGSGNGVFARRYARSGGALAADFRVNVGTTGTQSEPALAVDAFGRIAVVFQAPDASSNGIFVRMFDSVGVPYASTLAVNSYVTGTQASPAVATLPDGELLITWTDLHTPRTIRGQIVTLDADVLGSEILISPTPGPSLDASAVAAAPDGTFLVAWDDGADVWAQRFRKDGAREGGELRVNATVAQFQQSPRVAANPASYLVVWRSGASTAVEDIFGQRYGLARVKGDANGDGAVSVADVFHLISFLFAGGPPPQ